jgi:hypothetical protein
MQDVNMGEVCLPGAILPGIGRDFCRKVPRSGRMKLDLPGTVHCKRIEIQEPLSELVAQSFLSSPSFGCWEGRPKQLQLREGPCC